MADEAGNPAGVPYIGSLIALTSISGQRYRGTLYTVDLNESSIALQHVTLGADDSPSGPVYEFIKFRGCDIAELNVLANGPPHIPQHQSAPPPQVATAAPGQPTATGQATAGGGPIAPPMPQVSSWSQPGGLPVQQPLPPVAPPQVQRPSEQAASGTAGGRRAGAPTVMITPVAPPRPPPTSSQQSQPALQQQQQQQQQRQQQRQQQQPLQQQQPVQQQAQPSAGSMQGQHSHGPRMGRGRVDEQQGSAGRGGRGGGRSYPGRGRNGYARRGGPPPGTFTHRGPPPGLARPDNVPITDFDFEAALSKFNKADVLQEAEKGETAEAEAPQATSPAAAAKYDKDGFFDELSCEALDRLKIAEAEHEGGAPPVDGRARAAEQRKVDMETFGEVHKGGGKGFGRGRGRGRGRGSGYRSRGDSDRSGRGRSGGRGGGRMPTDILPPSQVAA